LQLSEEDFIHYQLENTPPVPEDFVMIKKRNMGS